MRDARAIAATTLIVAAASVLSSTLLSWAAIAGVKPDLALVIVALVAMRRGSMSGQVAGFVSGLLEDAISVAPLGFTAMIRTVVGYLIGRLEGVIAVDRLLLPAIIAVVATVLKAFSVTLLSLVFPGISTRYGIVSQSFLIEAALNGAVAPALYVLVRLLPALKPRSPRQVLRARMGP